MKESALSWEVRPHRGIGPVSIGDSRNTVHALLAEEPTVFSRSSQDGPEDEEYAGVGMFVYFDEHDAVEHIESFAVGQDSSPVIGSITLVGRSVAGVVSDLNNVGIHPDVDDAASKIFLQAGFAIFGSVDLVESVSVFRDGYYGDLARS
jgi:hypothetical protein